MKQVGARPIEILRNETHKIEEFNQTYCPHCKCGPLDGVTGFEFKSDKKEGASNKRIYPEDGSISICCECGELMAFKKIGEILTLEILPEDRLREIQNDPHHWNILQETKSFINQFLKKKKNNE